MQQLLSQYRLAQAARARTVRNSLVLLYPPLTPKTAAGLGIRGR